MPLDFLYMHNSEVKSKLKETYSIVSEKENTIQIVCVGNSDLYSGFSPLDLWNEYGFTSTICASAQQTVEESHYFVSKLLESQKPQFIIIETDMFYDCTLIKVIIVKNPILLRIFYIGLVLILFSRIFKA